MDIYTNHLLFFFQVVEWLEKFIFMMNK